MQNDEHDLRISSCSSSGCGWRCCIFSPMKQSYIVTFPGELAEARDQGQSIAHLHMQDDDRAGGRKVICTARDTATCDQGYKPVECQLFPFFPAAVDANGSVRDLLWGKQCPLNAADQVSHREKVLRMVAEICRSRPELVEWFNTTATIGYVREHEHPVSLIQIQRSRRLSRIE
jgi:hypothetical protein